jgi:hypothetical protein
MGRLALFFNGEFLAVVFLLDPIGLAVVASMPMGSGYCWAYPTITDSNFGNVVAVVDEDLGGLTLLRAMASSPWMLKITPSSANTPIMISRALTISEATAAE